MGEAGGERNTQPKAKMRALMAGLSSNRVMPVHTALNSASTAKAWLSEILPALICS